MDIVAYGGTGMVGSRVVGEAVRRGHTVRAVSRSGREVEGATAITGDLGDTAALTDLAADADAVVIAVSTDRTGGSPEPVIEAHQAIVDAAPKGRLLIVGGAGALLVDGEYLKDTPGFPDAYRGESEAFTRVLDLYRGSSDLDWTMIAPAPEIAPGERTGEYRVGGDEVIGPKVSAEDFAVAVVDELEQPAHRGSRFAVAN